MQIFFVILGWKFLKKVVARWRYSIPTTSSEWKLLRFYKKEDNDFEIVLIDVTL